MTRTAFLSLASFRFSLVCAGVAAAQFGAVWAGPGDAPRNVLVIVADDVGIDMIHQFGSHPASAPTPNIDQLCAEGVSFMNAFTDPICSPTRAGIMTGRYAVRSLIGRPIHEWQNAWSLPLTTPTLPKLIAQHAPTPVAMFAVGKWHLGTVNNGDTLHPNLSGFPHFSGILGNFSLGTEYTNWTKVVNGVSSNSTTYATTDQVDDAIARIGVMPEPWFLYLGFSAAHIPFHAPPANLHTYNLSGPPDATPVEHYRAAVQAMDTEIGRLMQSIAPEVRENTTVIFLADNGSVTDAVLPPGIPNHSKGTLFEGGVRVPFVISGAGVAYPGSRCYALVQGVDVFSTTLDVLGIDPQVATPATGPSDGLSLLPYLARPWAASRREFVYAQRFDPNGPPPYTAAGYMVRDARWKYIDRGGPGNLFFDLANGAGAEQVNLFDQPLDVEQTAALKRLRSYLARIVM